MDCKTCGFQPLIAHVIPQKMKSYMNNQLISLLTKIVIIIGSVNICWAEMKPPKVYIENGICPGEYCHYGNNYVALKNVDTFDKPNGVKIGIIKKGTKVQSMTGDVYSVPLQVERVPRRGKIFKDGKWIPSPEPDCYANEKLDIDYGEEFFVLRYAAEGWWLAWHNGEIIQVPEIWDTDKLGEPQNTWWIQLKTDKGRKVWVKAEPSYKKFSNSFECFGAKCNEW